MRAASKRTTDFVGAEQVVVEVLNSKELSLQDHNHMGWSSIFYHIYSVLHYITNFIFHWAAPEVINNVSSKGCYH